MKIQHLTKLRYRLIVLAIAAIVLPLAGYALLWGGGGEGLIPSLIESVGDNPLWSQVVRYLIIAALAYGSFRVAAIVLGTLEMRAEQKSFSIKKGILGVGFTRSIPRSQMTGLEQTTWTKIQEDADGKPSRNQFWRLVLLGGKSMTLLDDETNPEDSEWLGQVLSDWYDLPFAKKSLPDKRRK